MPEIEITENFSLLPYNTFGIDVKASYGTVLKDSTQLSQIPFIWNTYEKVLILGEGSNVLFRNHFEGLVVLNRLKGITIEPFPFDNRYRLLHAAAGENWHRVVLTGVEAGLGGIENLSLIPGTAGAAPIQNIGAYGVELKDIFYSLQAIDVATGEEVTFDKENCMFGYRNSVFKHELKDKYLITRISLKLKTEPELKLEYGAIRETLLEMGVENPAVKDVSDAVIRIRQSKLPDPAVLGNAGSFFKNPEISRKHYELLQEEYADIPGYPTASDTVKIPAAWLIETCGWKGRRYGQTGAHEKQALVLVNYGGADGQSIYEHALRIADNVKSRFEITLTPEVNII